MAPPVKRARSEEVESDDEGPMQRPAKPPARRASLIDRIKRVFGLQPSDEHIEALPELSDVVVDGVDPSRSGSNDSNDQNQQRDGTDTTPHTPSHAATDSSTTPKRKRSTPVPGKRRKLDKREEETLITSAKPSTPSQQGASATAATPPASPPQVRASPSILRVVWSYITGADVEADPDLQVPPLALPTPTETTNQVETDENTRESDDEADEENSENADASARNQTEDFDSFDFIRALGPFDLVPRRNPVLPKKRKNTHNYTLVLDLDETLVHCSINPLENAALRFPVHVDNKTYDVSVRKRPGLHAFLERVSQFYEVVLFTASNRLYADRLLNLLDPEYRHIKHRLFREHCVLVQGTYVKDLSVLGRSLKRTIIIDNSHQAFALQLNNGVPIQTWTEDMCDQELLRLLPFLERIVTQNVEDVRPIIREVFRVKERVLAGHKSYHAFTPNLDAFFGVSQSSSASSPHDSDTANTSHAVDDDID